MTAATCCQLLPLMLECCCVTALAADTPPHQTAPITPLKSLLLVSPWYVSGNHTDLEVLPVWLLCRNRNGLIDREEWRQGLGDLGPKGDAAKDFLFDRINRTSQSDGQLQINEFGNLLILARTMILG